MNRAVMSKYFGICLFFLFVLNIPTLPIVSNHHDYGSQAMFEYLFVNKYQWGVDFIQNVGPYGFLNHPYLFTGILDNYKFILNTLVTLFLTFLTFEKLKHLHSGLFLLSLILIGHFLLNDIFFFYLVFIIFCLLFDYFIDNKKAINLKIYTSILFLALLTLTKGTILIICISSIIFLSLTLIVLKKYKLFLIFILSYLAFLILWWILAGQSINNLTTYFLSIIDFVSAYSEILVLYKNEIYTCITIFILILNIYILRFKLEDYKKNFLKIIYFLVLLSFYYILWKHSVVRSDGYHRFNLAFFSVPIATLFLVNFKKNQIKIFNGILFKISISLFLLANLFFLNQYNYNHKDKFFLNDIYSKIKIISNPIIYINNISTETSLNIKEMYFKNKILNNEKVSYIGMYPAFMLYNDWFFVPTPATISFIASNNYLINKNLNFIKNLNLKYIFFESNTLDNELLSMSDSKIKKYLLRNFEYKYSFKNKILLKRKENTLAEKLTLIESKKIFLNKWTTIPNNNNFIWVKIDYKKNILSKLISFIYKSEKYNICIELESGEILKYRYWLDAGKAGFLLKPLVTNKQEFIDYIQNNKEKNIVKKIKIESYKNKFLSINEFDIKIYDSMSLK